MVHKIKYFEADELKEGIYLQDVVNDFLAEKGEKKYTQSWKKHYWFTIQNNSSFFMN